MKVDRKKLDEVKQEYNRIRIEDNVTPSIQWVTRKARELGISYGYLSYYLAGR